jgi:capsular polysaccharide biosynthesis protein/cellulose biosynthesis protein BcsQ
LNQGARDSDFVEVTAEEPVDAGRYLNALRRRLGLIAAASFGIALLVLLLSLALPKSYNATAQIALPTQLSTSASTSSQAQSLATIEAYIRSPTVLSHAASRLRTSMASLKANVSASLDTSANIINVTATDRSAVRAAQLANGVAKVFLSVRTRAEQAQLAHQQSLLTRKLSAAHAAGSVGLVAALEQQISTVAAQEASAGSDLELLAPALVPESPSSPRPARNAVLALVAALVVVVLAVLGRELVAPTVSSGRELSALLGIPILGRVPRMPLGRQSRRRAPSPAEAEAYRFVSKSLELALSPRRPQLAAVTSAAREEGKTTVVSRLGIALAGSGSKTLLVSADLRWPTLHEAFGLPLGDGRAWLESGANALPRPGRAADAPAHPRLLTRSALARDAPAHKSPEIAVPIADGLGSAITQVRANLDLLPSGPPLADPTAVLTNDAIGGLFARIRRLDYDYVLFDLPPLLAAAETQLFVRHADSAVLVSFVGRTTTEQLLQTRELLDRLSVQPAGIVMLGVRRADAPGAFGPRFRLVRNESQSA